MKPQHCLYCFSDQIVQVQQPLSTTIPDSSGLAGALATLGLSAAKKLPYPVPPLIGGVLGAIAGKVLSQVLDQPLQNKVIYFHCQNCSKNFQ